MGRLPASFLGGSAPLLQSLYLSRVPYPALPILLSSARDLVDLQVLNIPDTSSISSKHVVACLSSLTRLTTFALEFDSERHFHPLPVAQRSAFVSAETDCPPFSHLFSLQRSLKILVGPPGQDRCSSTQQARGDVQQADCLGGYFTAFPVHRSSRQLPAAQSSGYHHL